MFVTHDNILSFLSNEISEGNNKIILIKDSDKLSLRELYNYLLSSNSIIKCFYENLQKSSYEPYFPFLSFIKEELESSKIAIENFLGNVTIYPNHKDIFISYINSNRTKREEDINPFDYKYEKNKLYESLLNIFNKYDEHSDVYILLENINYIRYSTLEWIKWLVKNDNDYKFKIILTITSYEYFIPELQYEFENFIEMIESKYSLLQIDNNKYSKLENDINGKNTYVCDLLSSSENLFQFLALDEALYCFIKQYNLMKKIDKVMVNKELDHVLTRLGDIYLLKEDFHNSYVYYDLLFNKAVELNNNYAKANAFQKLSMLEVLRLKFNTAERFAKNSYKISVALEDDYLKLKSYELLFWINEKGKYRTTIENLDFEEEFITLAKRYKQNNILAYFLTHSFNALSFRGPKDQREDYYNEGYVIAKELKNENCILSAHLKTALVYAVNGFHNISQEYYEKVENLLIAMKDDFRLAQTYNGIGYYYLTAGKFEEANEYYDKSLQHLKIDWNFDEICMTLINKSINAMLVSDYATAEKQLEVLISVAKELKLERLRLTTLSRIYGILALNHFYLGNLYRSYSFLSKMQTVISPNKYYEDDDEYFLNNFTQGLLLRKQGFLKNAEEYFQEALFHISKIKGSLKCFYPKFTLEYKKLLLQCKKDKEAEQITKMGYDYCKKNNLLYYLDIFEGKKVKKYYFGDNLSQITWIIEAVRQEASIRSLNDKVDEINFINNFQEILTSLDDKENIIKNSMTLLENKFTIDYTLLISYDKNTIRILYSSKRIEIDNNKLDELKDILKVYENPIVSADEIRLNKYVEGIIEEQIKSLIYIPVIRDNKLKVSFLCVTKVDNDVVNNKIVLNTSNLRIINIAIKQLAETIQKIQWQEKLIESASTDMLTELYNRQYFYNKISSLINQSSKNNNIENDDICLFYIDLDNFKYYNDTFGHTVGDSVLIWFGEILKFVVPKKSTVIRYGGDEFILLVQKCSEEDAKVIVNKIYESIRNKCGFKEKIAEILETSIEIPEKNLISCSIGIICNKLNKNLNISKFVENADKSLYEAKRAGKGRYVIFKEII